ncbi:DUF2075 domain-containing protein [Glycomyces salinus]|uniref:DUF2075 domain-containing protein n=1 Tax=Glycomyces salinus TaxID=980294 RepID=UPI0018EB2AA3|nr:DUF2075 domain-containing protein [Glycomyces salinus]
MSAQSLARVDTAFPGGRISLALSEQYRHQFGTEASAGEQRSWNRSLPVIAQDLIDAGLPKVEVLMEHRLPLTSKRIDVILAGTGHDGGDRYVIVELKQWSEAELFEDDPELVLVPGLGPEPKLHPSLQARGYRDYLADFVEGLRPEAVESIAYLHNAQDGDVFDLFDLPDDDRSRLFTGSRRSALIDYLRSRFAPEPGAGAADRLETARIRPSKQLLDHAAEELKNRDQFVLLEEQRTAFELVLHLVKKSWSADNKEVVVITGGPGSGKSVIALTLLARLAEENYAALHATGSRSFTETMRKHVARGSTRLKSLFKYFNSFMKADRNGLDVLICDEAHRIRETSANRFTKQENRTGRLQIDELMSAARVPVFLLDEHQVVRPGEIGTVADIEAYAELKGFKVHQVDLADQFRCGGSTLYEEWVLRLLDLEPGGPTPWEGDDQFEVGVAGTPWELETRLAARLHEGYSSRMAAGYCWKWSDPTKDLTLIPDVVVDDWSRPWNVKGDRSVGDAPPASLWASREGGFGQVGCVYTAQGFEYDYNGVIIGPDLVYRDGRFVTDRSASKDPALTRKTTDAEADRLIRNTYKVLLTRGLRGTLLYSTDPETQEFLTSLIRARSITV